MAKKRWQARTRAQKREQRERERTWPRRRKKILIWAGVALFVIGASALYRSMLPERFGCAFMHVDDGTAPIDGTARLLWRHVRGEHEDIEQSIEIHGIAEIPSIALGSMQSVGAGLAKTTFPSFPDGDPASWHARVLELDARGGHLASPCDWQAPVLRDVGGVIVFPVREHVPGTGFADRDALAWMLGRAKQLRAGDHEGWSERDAARAAQFFAGCLVSQMDDLEPAALADLLLVAADVGRVHDLAIDVPVLQRAATASTGGLYVEVLRSLMQLAGARLRFGDASSDQELVDITAKGRTDAERALARWLLLRKSQSFVSEDPPLLLSGFDPEYFEQRNRLRSGLPPEAPDPARRLLGELGMRDPAEVETILARERRPGGEPSDDARPPEVLAGLYVRQSTERQLEDLGADLDDEVGDELAKELDDWGEPVFMSTRRLHGLSFELARWLVADEQAMQQLPEALRKSAKRDARLADEIGPLATLDSLRAITDVPAEVTTKQLVAEYTTGEDPARWRLVEALALSGELTCLLALDELFAPSGD